MTPTWRGAAEPEATRFGAAGWARIVFRGVPLGLVVFGGLALLLTLRLIERPMNGPRRPWTPWITQAVCRTAFVLLGIRHRIHGSRMGHRGAVVANHSTWLDIFTLNAGKRIYFVSKAEVAKWVGIGWLARATGTVFITRAAREARAQKATFEERLTIGHKLLFFPEGTSSDGQRVLPFKSALFAAFFSEGLKDLVWVQPVTVVYTAPEGRPKNFYGWWGDMEFGPHLLKILAASPQGAVDVHYHDPVRVADFEDRKALALYCEEAVRSKFPERA